LSNSLKHLKSVGTALILTGVALFLISSIPITRTDDVINTSFTIHPSQLYDPYDEGTYYHTRVLAKSILKIHINAEGEGLHISASGHNVQDLEEVLVEGQKDFTIAPANDQYIFTFANKGKWDCVVEFTLTEVWTSSISPVVRILGLTGLFLLVPIGSGLLALNHYTRASESNTLFHSCVRRVLDRTNNIRLQIPDKIGYPWSGFTCSGQSVSARLSPSGSVLS
jgi:hypothetical protein